MNELTTTGQISAQEPSPMQMIGAIVNSPDVTAEKVSLAERIMQMMRQTDADESKKAFVRAFVQMQREMKAVRAQKEVKSEAGKWMYDYAPFEDIRAQADPILVKNGFAVAFDTRIEGERLISIFTLMHEGGYSQSNQFAARLLQTNKMMNGAQADMGTKTLAMRGAFCDGCGIVIDKEGDRQDARVLGGTITAEKVEELKLRVRDRGYNETKFLRHVQAQDFEAINDAGYRRGIEWLDAADVKYPKKHDGPLEEW
jgi:hypothetical protein